MKCEQCRYWDDKAADPFTTDRYCRRRAPVVVVRINKDSSWSDTVWPKTGPEDWCGKFAPKGNPAEDTRKYLETISNIAKEARYFPSEPE